MAHPSTSCARGLKGRRRSKSTTLDIQFRRSILIFYCKFLSLCTIVKRVEKNSSVSMPPDGATPKSIQIYVPIVQAKKSAQVFKCLYRRHPNYKIVTINFYSSLCHNIHSYVLIISNTFEPNTDM